MPNVGVPELLIVLVIALVIFGPKKLPELGRSLGHGIREFRGSVSGDSDDDDDDEDSPPEIEGSATVEPNESEAVGRNSA